MLLYELIEPSRIVFVIVWVAILEQGPVNTNPETRKPEQKARNSPTKFQRPGEHMIKAHVPASCKVHRPLDARQHRLVFLLQCLALQGFKVSLGTFIVGYTCVEFRFDVRVLVHICTLMRAYIHMATCTDVYMYICI